jgi:hypothetical protein
MDAWRPPDVCGRLLAWLVGRCAWIEVIGCMYAALAPGRGVTRWCRWKAPVGGGCPVSGVGRAVVRVVSCGVVDRVRWAGVFVVDLGVVSRGRFLELSGQLIFVSGKWR